MTARKAFMGSVKGYPHLQLLLQNKCFDVHLRQAAALTHVGNVYEVNYQEYERSLANSFWRSLRKPTNTNK